MDIFIEHTTIHGTDFSDDENAHSMMKIEIDVGIHESRFVACIANIQLRWVGSHHDPPFLGKKQRGLLAFLITKGSFFCVSIVLQHSKTTSLSLFDVVLLPFRSSSVCQCM